MSEMSSGAPQFDLNHGRLARDRGIYVQLDLSNPSEMSVLDFSIGCLEATDEFN